MGIDQLSGRIIDVLFIITVLTALVLLVLTARRIHLTISDVSNGTGRNEFNDCMAGASANFRRAVEAQLEQVREMIQGYRTKVRNAPESTYSLDLTRTGDALRRSSLMGQSDPWAALLTSLEPGPSRGAAAQLQALGQMVAQPRSATVTATVLRSDKHDDRLGIIVEVVSPASWWAKRRPRLLWESDHPAAGLPRDERIDALIQPAARCAAIDLTAWVLQRSRRLPLPGANKHREGLTRNLAGMVMKASEARFSLFAEEFRVFAMDEFDAAKNLLPNNYLPHSNLAGVYEAEGEIASPTSRHSDFMSAVSEYRAARDAADSLPGPAQSWIQRKMTVRLIRAELASGIGQLQRDALRSLEKQRFRVEQDCRFEQSRGWRAAWHSGEVRVILDAETAESLFDSACMYAIAARMTGRVDWDQHARMLLGTALVIDAGEGDLWYQAVNDPDLVQLSWHLPEFLDQLRGILPEVRAQQVPLPEIQLLVDHARAGARWWPAPAAKAHAAGKRLPAK